MNYTIYIVSPDGYIHSRAFAEVALVLQEGLRELGYDPDIVYKTADIKGRAIVLGANLLPHDLPEDAIIFNLEQGGSGWMRPAYIDLMRRHETWSYADLDKLKERGVDAKFCGIGYGECLRRIAPAKKEDIDVLFYGSLFGRRLPILDAIEAKGLKCKRLFGVYGTERDRWIARSKIILNLHAYENSPFETVRTSYLLANKKFVLSEPIVPPHLAQGIAQAPASELPKMCNFYVKTDGARYGIAARGHELFSAQRQSRYLQDLVKPRRWVQLDWITQSDLSDQSDPCPQ